MIKVNKSIDFSTYPASEFRISIQTRKEGLFLTLEFTHEWSRKLLKTLRRVRREKGLGRVSHIHQPSLSTHLLHETQKNDTIQTCVPVWEGMS